MSTPDSSTMSRTRALMTDTERKQIAGEESRQRRYEATARVRRRVQEELVEDVEVLAEHHPELLDELRDVVCE